MHTDIAMMEPTDPLTKTNIFQFPVVTRQLVASFALVGLATLLVALRFVARQVRKTNVWYVYSRQVRGVDKRTLTQITGGMMLPP